MNHHCQPNAQMRPWIVPEEHDQREERDNNDKGPPARRLVCQAIEDIKTDDEICWSYMNENWVTTVPDTDPPIILNPVCACGKPPGPHTPTMTTPKLLMSLVPYKYL
jgi:hypothetical protein